MRFKVNENLPVEVADRREAGIMLSSLPYTAAKQRIRFARIQAPVYRGG